MKLVFVDETDRQESAQVRKFFCICGLVIDESNLLEVTNQLEDIKTKYGLSNLKESRKSGLDEKTKLKLTQEIFECLQGHGAKMIGIILGDFSMSYKLPKVDLYMGATSFLIERIALSLLKDGRTGVVVFDELEKKLERNFRKKFYEYIRTEHVQMAWDVEPTCLLKDHVLPTLLFTDDEQSILIQAVDLIATSLNSGVVNTTKGKKGIVVSELPKGNKFLEIYWDLFDKSPKGKVNGWGIKIWD